MNLREKIEEALEDADATFVGYDYGTVGWVREVADTVLSCIDGPVVEIPEIYIGYARVKSRGNLDPAPEGHEYRLTLVKKGRGDQ